MEQPGTADQYESIRYYVVMSDKHILKKTSWRRSDSKLDSTPWNDLGRLSVEVSAYVQKLRDAGYSEVTHG